MRAIAAPLVLLLVACTDPAAPPRVLLFTKTNGYRHADAIAAAGTALPASLATLGIDSEGTEDPTRFTPAELATFDAVVFLYTSGNDLLDATGKAALEAFVRDGGGWVGVHSAADTEYAWPFYGELVVAPFEGHPAIQAAWVQVEAPSHPAMATTVPEPWVAEDEWYNFQRNPRATAGVEILATLDESTYAGGTMGSDHPIVWAHENAGGRALYTALGHLALRWDDSAFRDHIATAVSWAARAR